MELEAQVGADGLTGPSERPRLLADVYDVSADGPPLGTGAFAVTHRALHRATGEHCACKSVDKAHAREAAAGGGGAAAARSSDGSSGHGAHEARALRSLSGHPHIIALEDAFEDEAHVHLVMELCEGGSLLEAVMARGRYPEAEAAAIMRALLSAIAHAHGRGWVHRDIKLDNLLFKDADGSPASLRLIDFGLSSPFTPGEKLTGLRGTSFYIAPEVLSSPSYDEKADVWSCGVVAYTLLCGRPPFSGARQEAIWRHIVNDGIPDMCGEPWGSIPEGAKDAVRRMMTWHPSRRPSAQEMLQHEWVAAAGAGSGGAAAGSPASTEPGTPEALRSKGGGAAPPASQRRSCDLAAAGADQDGGRADSNGGGVGGGRKPVQRVTAAAAPPVSSGGSSSMGSEAGGGGLQGEGSCGSSGACAGVAVAAAAGLPTALV